MGQKYPIGTTFESKFVNEDDEDGTKYDDVLTYRVVYYEESLSSDRDDHYEVCFDEELKLTLFTKQSRLDRLDRIR